MTRSNTFTLVTVLIRVAALTSFAVLVLSMIPLLLGAAPDAEGESTVGWQLGTLAVGGLIFLVVWLFADLLARLSLASPKDPGFESDIDPTEWRSICFSAVGVWFAATALLQLVNQGARWFYVQRLSAEQVEYSWGELLFGEFVTSLARLALGIALLLGSRGLASWLRRMRGRETDSSRE